MRLTRAFLLILPMLAIAGCGDSVKNTQSLGERNNQEALAVISKNEELCRSHGGVNFSTAYGRYASSHIVACNNDDAGFFVSASDLSLPQSMQGTAKLVVRKANEICENHGGSKYMAPLSQFATAQLVVCQTAGTGGHIDINALD